MIEAAAIMGWFVFAILAEKYLNDATQARRAAEDKSSQQSIVSALLFCAANSLPSLQVEIPGVSATASLDMLMTGAPQMAMQIVPPLIAGLGLAPMKTLPYYFNPFRAADVISIGTSVQAAQPLGYRSEPFRAQRTTACLEPSLDLPGAPWVNLRLASLGVFVTNILGYKL